MTRFMPRHTITLALPDMLDPGGGRSRANMRHNTAAKAALKKVLIWHHTANIPKHFRPAAKTKYGYYKRQISTNVIKRKKGKARIDLVDSGKAKRRFMTRAPIRVGGKTYGDSQFIKATMLLRWPPGYYDNPNVKPGHVTKAKMRDEMERWTSEEESRAAELFIKEFKRELAKAFKSSPRLLKKYSQHI